VKASFKVRSTENIPNNILARGPPPQLRAGRPVPLPFALLHIMTEMIFLVEENEYFLKGSSHAPVATSFDIY